MKKLIILLLCVLTFSIESYSQNRKIPLESLYKQSVVATPDMAALAKNIKYPINYSTGTPEIRIPLYTIHSGTLTLPISLVYNASGIRVDDIPGVAGQGWTLAGVPTISRKVNGHIDNHYTCQFDESTPITDIERVKWLLDDQNPYSSNDEQPDEYYYQLADKSGMFVYVMRPSVQGLSYASIPYNNIKIEMRSSFKLTDEDGVSYCFDGAEDKVDFYNAPRVVSGWKASSMVSANGLDSITFLYDGICAYPVHQRNESCTVVDGFTSNNPTSRWPRDALYTSYYDINNQYVPGCEIEEVMKAPVVYYTHKDSRDSYQVDNNGNLFWDKQPTVGPLGFKESLNTFSAALKSISFKGNTILFAYKSYNSTLYLSSLIVKNFLGEVVRTIDLKYDFYTSNRCFLKSVSFSDTSDHEIEKYSFEYEKPYSLPPVGDNRIDFWGYYNGNRQGGTIVPRMTLQTQVDYPRWHNPQYYSNTSLTIGASNWDNRASDEMYMRYGTLKSISYPTGAKDEFQFEANQIKFSGERQESEFYISDHLIAVPGKERTYYVGGLRVRQIKTTMGDTCVNYRTFSYNSDGTGTSPINESVNYFLSERTKYYYDTYAYQGSRIQVSSRYRTISSTPLLPLSFCNGAIVMYGTVTEYNGRSDNDNDGKTVYQYNVPTYKWNVMDVFERWNHMFRDWQYGHLLAKTIYKRAGQAYSPLQKDEYTYTSNCDIGKVWYGDYRLNTVINLPNAEIADYPDSWDDFIWARQAYTISSYLPGSNTKTVYDNEGHSQVTTHTFSYTIPNCTLMTGKTTRRNGLLQSESYDYPYHFRMSSPYDSMQIKNNLSPIIRTTQTRSSKSIVSMSPLSAIYKPLLTKYSFDGGDYIDRISYRYDEKGNVVQTSKDDRENVVYLYGYNNQYPIVVIENASYDAVVSVLGEEFVSSLRQSLQPSTYQWNRISALRNRTDWHITIYKYKPLVGVTSITDPSGKEISYSYDALGRLTGKRLVTNGNTELLEEYNYHYKTESHE